MDDILVIKFSLKSWEGSQELASALFSKQHTLGKTCNNKRPAG